MFYRVSEDLAKNVIWYQFVKISPFEYEETTGVEIECRKTITKKGSVDSVAPGEHHVRTVRSRFSFRILVNGCTSGTFCTSCRSADSSKRRWNCTIRGTREGNEGERTEYPVAADGYVHLMSIGLICVCHMIDHRPRQCRFNHTHGRTPTLPPLLRPPPL